MAKDAGPSLNDQLNDYEKKNTPWLIGFSMVGMILVQLLEPTRKR